MYFFAVKIFMLRWAYLLSKMIATKLLSYRLFHFIQLQSIPYYEFVFIFVLRLRYTFLSSFLLGLVIQFCVKSVNSVFSKCVPQLFWLFKDPHNVNRYLRCIFCVSSCSKHNIVFQKRKHFGFKITLLEKRSN